MYKNSEEVFDNLVRGKVKLSSVTRSMHKCIKRKDIEQYTIFAKAKGMYKIWENESGNKLLYGS